MSPMPAHTSSYPPPYPVASDCGCMCHPGGWGAGTDSQMSLGVASPLPGLPLLSCCAGVRCDSHVGVPCPDSGFCGRTCRCKPSLPSEAEKAAQELENQIKERQGLFFDMEAYLPKQNG